MNNSTPCDGFTNVGNPGFERGIRIGNAQNGWALHPRPARQPGDATGSGPESGTVHKHGLVLAGEPSALGGDCQSSGVMQSDDTLCTPFQTTSKSP
jgi:hypothetical protein